MSTTEESPAAAQSGRRDPGLVVHCELSPLAQWVVTVVGDLDAKRAPRLLDAIGRLEHVNTLDLRFVPTIDESGVDVLRDVGNAGLERIVGSAELRALLEDERLGGPVELVRPSDPPYLHRARFGVAVHDHELRYVYVNDSLAAINGLPAQAHYGHALDVVFDAADDELLTVLDRVRTTGRPERHLVEARIDDEVGRWICHYGPVELDTGRGVVAIIGVPDEGASSSIRVHLRRRRTADGLVGGAVPIEGPPEPLSPREWEVLRLLAAGLGNRAIATRLFVSVETVKSHCQRLYRKLGVSSRMEAAALVRGGELRPVAPVTTTDSPSDPSALVAAERESLVDLFHQVAVTMGDRFDRGSVFQQLCLGAVAILGADAAAVSVLRTDGTSEVVAATDPELEADVATGAGRASHVTLSLTVGEQQLGALTVYQRSPREWADEDLDAVSALAAVVTAHVLRAGQLADAMELVRQLQAALDSRVVIEQAKGVLRRHHDVELEAAFELLRAYAREHGRSIHDVARGVVESWLDVGAGDRAGHRPATRGGNPSPCRTSGDG